MRSTKEVKKIEDLIGKKTFFFPNELANERVTNNLLPCILVQVNGKKHFILTGQSVELTLQEFAILKDSGMLTDKYTYQENKDFDPIRNSYKDL